MKKLLITGTDTSIGKTYTTCLLARQMRQSGLRTGIYKPVCSGSEPGRDGVRTWPDLDAIQAELSADIPLDLICPQRFHASIAPSESAKAEGEFVDESVLVEGCSAWQAYADFLLIEGAGGLLCPLTDSLSVAGFAERCQLPIVVVASNRLGMVNHTLLTIEAARSRGLQIRAVVLNQVTQPNTGEGISASEDGIDWIQSTDMTTQSSIRLLVRWAGDLPIFGCGYQGHVLTPVANVPPNWQWHMAFS
ncbi:MAG: dethiobiotin synthase [Planctomycetaceae bacterium]|nr:dethiobiotin synthase [Planctomycetaceae bacterium]